MQRTHWLLGLSLALAPLTARAQPWSGLLAPARAVDWTRAGAAIVRRTTPCGPTIAAYSGSAATINDAIAACPSGQVVQLGAGTFTLSNGIYLGRSNVTLRGMGASRTRLVIGGVSPSACGLFYSSGVTMCTSSGGGHLGSTDGGG